MDSPFQQHFGTNYVPTDDEVQQIRNEINGATREVHDLDIEIDQLQQQLDVLQVKRSNILHYVEQHQALISPARRLTDDVLTCIFLACLPEDENPAMYAEDAPSLLTRVCSSWRRVALSTPRLWAAFHVELPSIEYDYTYSVPNDLEHLAEITCRTHRKRQFLVNRWIERSGACPLSISIYQLFETSLPEESEELLMPLEKLRMELIENTILPCHHRWYSLDLYISELLLEYLMKFLLYVDRELPMLRELHLTRYLQRMPISTFSDFLSILPSKATSATFYNIFINNPEVTSGPWVCLTELNLNLVAPDIDFTPSILLHFPSLITLELILGAHRIGHMMISETIVLQHLKTLSLSISLVFQAIDLSKNLHLPLITSLDIQMVSVDGAGTVDMAEEMIRSLLRATRDFHTLTLLELSWMQSPNDLVQILKSVRNVKCLKLLLAHKHMHNRCVDWQPYNDEVPVKHDWLFNDDLLQALMPTEKDYSDIICPQLEEFECIYYVSTGLSEIALKELLIARRNAHLIDNRISNIQRLYVFINDYKRKGQSDSEEKISLGAESAIHFRKRTQARLQNSSLPFVDDSDVYTEL